jgi:adenine-specific DNA-methyltransferase
MELNKDFPSVVKYMGSKTDVLDLIEKGFNCLGKKYDYVCDLFAGSATLSAALRGKVNVISNDVQMYSEVFTNTYLNNYCWSKYPEIKEVVAMATERYENFNNFFHQFKGHFSYDRDFSLQELNEMENEQRALMESDIWKDFDNYYLFVQNYSGTYWSYDQCIWIDSYRCIIDQYKEDIPYYNLLLTCLIYAMAYNSQSTGHYAQYRVPESESSKDDILIYRRKNITDFFERKYADLYEYLKSKNPYTFQTYAEKDIDCLNSIPEGTLVYADPPYCFVHYSRFYHILETLVRYDYPELKYKGRYRTDRYQSNYCIKTEVADAFSEMFYRVKMKKADLMLSYTNSETNTISFEELLKVFCGAFNPGFCDDGNLEAALKKCDEFFQAPDLEMVSIMNTQTIKELPYSIMMIKKPYNHSRMGRKNTKTIPVTEVVILAKHED